MQDAIEGAKQHTWLFSRNGGDRVKNHTTWGLISISVLGTRKCQCMGLLYCGVKKRDSQKRALCYSPYHCDKMLYRSQLSRERSFSAYGRKAQWWEKQPGWWWVCEAVTIPVVTQSRKQRALPEPHFKTTSQARDGVECSKHGPVGTISISNHNRN